MDTGYRIQGTDNLYINKELEIYRRNDKPSTKYELLDNGRIKIAIYGVINILPLRTLYLISYRSMFINHPAIYSNLNRFDFVIRTVKYLTREQLITVCILKEPIEILHNNVIYRVISEYTRGAISGSGALLDLVTNKIRRANIPADQNVYPTITLYKRDKIATSRMIHRLVAYAWCRNSDPVANSIVNHMDGNKQNFHATNLEWCNYKHNSEHAVAEGLRPDAVAVKIKNIDTKEEYSFPSMGTATDFIGRTKITLSSINPIKSKRIVEGTSGRYEMKYADDNTPWLIDTNPKELNTNTQVIKFYVSVNGDRYICNNVDDLREVVRDVLKSSIEFPNNEFIHSIKKFERNFPHIPSRLEYLEENRHSAYLYRNSETNEVFSATDRKEIMEATGGSKSTIQKSISTNGAYAINNIWYAKFDDGKEFAVPAEIKNKSTPILLHRNGETTKYESIRAVARAMDVDKRTIQVMLKKGSEVYGIRVSYA